MRGAGTAVYPVIHKVTATKQGGKKTVIMWNMFSFTSIHKVTVTKQVGKKTARQLHFMPVGSIYRSKRPKHPEKLNVIYDVCLECGRSFVLKLWF